MTPLSMRCPIFAPRAVLAAGVLVLAACAPEAEPVGEREGRPAPAERVVEIVPRTAYLPTYPCGEQCHDMREPDPTHRPLTIFHAGRHVEHGPGIDWCDRCHTIDDEDQLHLMDGTSVSFDESDRVCGQCHGPEHRDWSEGMHGVNTGGWRGTVHRRLCTACHDPHTPGPLHFEALPPPTSAEPRHRDEEGDRPSLREAAETEGGEP